MITREELLKSPEYWFEDAQNELYRQVVEYKEKNGINQTELAKELGVTKGYVSQILKGEFNYTLKKLIEISLAVGKVPHIEYKSIAEVLREDKQTYHLHAETSASISLNESEYTTTVLTSKGFGQFNPVANGNSSLPVGETSLSKEGFLLAGENQYLKTA